MTLPNAIGIDVAKATLSICLHFPCGKEDVLTIRNIKTEIMEDLLPRISQYTGKVVMESTGHYHWLVALLLSEHGYDVYVVNPILSKQYTSGNIRKVKTDPQDAKGLARMALVAENLPHPFMYARETLVMRKKISVLASMTKKLHALKASLASMEEAQEILGAESSEAITALQESVKDLQKKLLALEKECCDNPSRQKERELLTSIPGMSSFCAQLCLHWFSGDPTATAKSWIAYAGLDVSVRESGTWKGQCHLTKRGNSYLRKRLFAAGWGAWMWDDDFKEYYRVLREEKGRSHTEALVIMTRKIIRIAFMVLETETPYDRRKCF